MNFYDNLKKLCDERGVKVTPTLSKAGLTNCLTTYYKNGREPKLSEIVALSKVLKVSADTLIMQNENKTTEDYSEEEQYINSKIKEATNKQKEMIINYINFILKD